jgi:hypothetical protein
LPLCGERCVNVDVFSTINGLRQGLYVDRAQHISNGLRQKRNAPPDVVARIAKLQWSKI